MKYTGSDRKRLTIGDIVSIGTNDCLYYCFPKEGDVVAKTRLATEELYKLKTGHREWEDIYGYTEEEMKFYKQLVKNNAHAIIEFSQDGGILHTSTS